MLNYESNTFMKHNSWPSADEEMIRYNAQYEDGIEIVEELSGNGPDKDPYSYFYSMPKLMLKDIEYESLVEDDAAEVFLEYLKSIDYDFFDENLENYYESDDKVFVPNGEYLNLMDPLDRTLKTPVVDETIFTIEFVRHLQQTLLKEYPLWRLHVHEKYPEKVKGLTIYPDVVVAGEKQSPPEDLDGVLSNWRHYIFDSREKERGPRRRQTAEIRRRLPQSIERLKKQLNHPDAEPFVMIAAFDNWRGNENLISLWSLGTKELKGLIIHLPSNEDVVGSSNGCHWVTIDGSLKTLFEEGDYRLEQFLFSKKYLQGKYEFLLSEYINEGGTRISTGNKWKVCITPNEILSDKELKILELERNKQTDF